MAVQFNSNIRHLMIGRGLLAGFAAPAAITIYGGAKPTAAQITSSWTSYNTNYLAHYIGGTWTQPSSGTMLSLTTIPPAVNATNSGTGTWCILWASNVSGASVAGASLPNTQFIVGDVTDFAGPGIIRFTDPAFTSGVSKVILLGAITAVMA
jgi:hypothetical protein